MKKIMIIFLIIPILVFGETVSDQLKKSGYEKVMESLEKSSQRSIRYKSIYPDGAENKENEADKLYGDDYVIRDINEMDDTLKDRVVMYHPTIEGNSMFGLTGLINTVSAKCLKKGEYSIGGKFSYYKIKKSKDKEIEFGAGEKADANSFFITAAMGVSDNFEIGYVLPVHSYEIIDDNLYPYDEKESGVGDVSLRGKFSFPFGVDRGYLAAGFGITLPSGNDEKMSPTGVTGEPALEVFGAVSSQFGLINGHINLMYSFTGNGDDSTKPYHYNDDKFTFNVGLDYSRNEIITLMLEVNGEDWGAYGDRADLVAGVRAKIGERFNAMLGFPLSIHNSQYYGYDFKMIAGGEYKF
ncbi:MAG: hypothetical protein ACOCWO_02590 [Candidatus Muiribacteriaceae bacterium]